MNKISIALVLFMLLPLMMKAQSYTKMWKDVEKAQLNDLPQTALKAVDKIISAAESKNNQSELIKAYITRISIAEDISSDSANVMYPKVDAIASKQTNPADKCLWNMVAGWLYSKRNMRLYPDSKQKAIEAFIAATSNPAALAEVNSKKYLPIVDRFDDSQYYNHDMLSVVFPFLAKEVRKLHTIDGDVLSHEIMGKEIAWYKSHNNREATLLAKLDSAEITHGMNEQILQNLIYEFAGIPLVTEACVDYIPSLNNKEKYEFINETLQKYPNTTQTNTLKNMLDELTRSEVVCRIPEEKIYPGESAKIYVAHKNMASATLSYTRLPYAASDSAFQNLRYKDYERISAKKDFEMKLDFNENLPYEKTRDTFNIKMPESGIYLVKLEGEGAEPDYGIMHVSSLAVMQLPLPKQKIKVCVVDIKNGKPVPNAHLRIKYNKEAGYYWKDYTADQNGELILDSYKYNADIYPSTPTDKALNSVSLTRSYDYNWNRDERDTKIQLYTDRAIYRPGQSVKVGGFLFNKDGDSTKVLNGIAFEIKLYGANNKMLESAKVRTDAFGAFGTEFTLPQECMNGNFRLETEYGRQHFKVEEYKRPKFYVTLQAPDKAYSLGDTITVTGEVKTYSGMPMGETKIFCSSERNRSWWFRSDDYDTPAIERDTITTDSEGRFQLPVVMSYPANSDLRYRYMVYTYKVNAKATANDGETEESTIYLNAGNWSSYISLNIPDVICKEQMPAIVASQTNSMGNSVKGEGYYVLMQNNDTLRSGTFEFNKKGQFDFIQSLPSGQYRLIVRPAGDNNKYNYASESFTLISLNDTKPVGSDKLQVWSSAESFKNGEPATILVGTPLKDTWLRYDLVANEKVIESKLIHLSDSIIRFNYTYNETYGKGVHAQFAIYDNGSLISKSVTITKPLPDKALQIKWTSFRDKLQPGANEKWTMQILKDNKPVNASVLATMYDASLDKFGKHTLPFYLNYNRDIPLQRWSSYYRYEFSINSLRKLNKLEVKSLSFTIPANKIFNPYGDMMVLREVAYGGARSNMMLKNVEPAFAPAEQALEGQVAGLDGAAEQDLTEQIELRSDFNETAFFASSLKTNSKGEVRIEFKLPQSLTSWNFHALAHTANLDYAFADTLITVEKPVAVQANMPRFLRSGDKTMLSVNIINNTDKPQMGKSQLSLTDAQTGKQIKLLTQNFNLKANQSTTVDFPIEVSIATPLLICKYVAVTKDFSDGEQQYIPVLEDLQETLTTVPFSLTDTDAHTISLKDLDYQPNAQRSTLSVEYTGNPAWTAIEALPSTIDYKTNCSTCLAINYSALSLMRQIIKDNPQIKTIVEQWNKNPQEETPLLALENNQELKQFILSETPWNFDADNERQRLAGLLQDEQTLALKQASMLDKLKALQTANGGWQWFPGMSDNTWLTIDIVEMLVRTRNLCPSTSTLVTPMINKAIAYLDKKAEREVEYLKEHKIKDIPTLWMRYLYVTSMGNWEKTSARKYLLNHLAQSATSYDLYDKSMAAVILKATGKDKEAQMTIKSLMEYTVSTPEMGRYFDGKKAPSSWSMYRIPTQVAAIEAISAVTPQEKQALNEMKLWLLQSKHTQAWNSPLAATQAIQCLLSSQMLAAPTSLPAQMELHTTGNKSVNIMDIATINPFIQMGYIKASMPTSDLGTAPKEIKVQQSAATIEQPLSYGAVYLQNYMPSSEIKDSGSELKLTMQMFKQTSEGWAPILSNTTLHKGDRIKVRYEIEASRDFDFVGLKDGRAACMEPTRNTSGWTGEAYRSVEDASTTWFFDRMSKGKHVIEETYDIDRKGTFTTACPQLQCQYAPEFTARAHNITIKVD